MGIIQTSKILRPRQKLDLYPTPVEAVRKYLDIIPFNELKYDSVYKMTTLDPGAGNGVWGGELSKRLSLRYSYNVGIECRSVRPDFFFDEWYAETDFLKWDSQLFQQERIRNH